MESMSTDKNVFHKKLLIENRRDYFRIQLMKIMEKWEKHSLVGVVDVMNVVRVQKLPEDDDDELDIF
tara:strand:+ start:438 stop:638 length:201 start_codon:yes stop_codon:yes gene_type:complete